MKTKKPNRPKRAKKAAVGRVMYETTHRRGGTIILHTRSEPQDKPVLVISLTSPEEYAKAVEEMSWTLCGAESGATAEQARSVLNRLPDKWHKMAVAALSALGCPSPSVSAKREKSGVRK